MSIDFHRLMKPIDNSRLYLSIIFIGFWWSIFIDWVRREKLKVSVKENEVTTEKNSSRASIFAAKASYTSN